MALTSLLHAVFRTAFRLSALGQPRGAHVTRYYMYRQLQAYSSPRPSHLCALSISRSAHLAQFLGFQSAQIRDVSYPDVSMLDLPFQNETFDAVVSDQVLEHVRGDPRSAIREAYRVLKPRGLALHTTCFVNPI